MDKLTVENQSNFLPGKNTTDNIVILQEIVHTLKKKSGKKSIMIVKIDLEKVCDRIEWDFLRFVLEKVGLSSQFVKLILYCVS